MEFFSYTLFDFLGIVQGLEAGKYIADALKEGKIITPILYFFILLSIVKISFHVIVEKEWLKALKDIAFLSLFAFVFLVPATFTVYNINLTKGIYKGDQNFWLSIEDSPFANINPDASNQSVKVQNIPIMYSMLSIADQLAYQIGDLIISRIGSYDSMIKERLKVAPQDIVSMAVMAWVSKEKDPAKLATKIKKAAQCFDVDKKIRDLLADKKSLTTEQKKTLAQLLSEVQEIPPVIDTTSTYAVDIQDLECSRIREDIANEIRNIADKVYDGNTKQDKVYRQFAYKVAQTIESGATPIALQEALLEGLIRQKELMYATNNLINATRDQLSSLSSIVETLKSKFDYYASNYVNNRLFNEIFMYKIQSIAIFVALLLFPIVLALAFLPAFGYNLRLLGSFILAFFLIKLWIPLYLIAYEFLMGRIFNLVKDVVAFIIPSSAFAADNLEMFTLLNTTLSQATDFTYLILNTLALVIPSTLGGGALLLLGRDFYMAAKTAIAESTLTAKMGMFMMGRGLTAFKGGKEISPSISSTTTSGTTQTNTLQTGTPITVKTLSQGGDITYKAFKDSKSGLWVAKTDSITTSPNIVSSHNSKTGIITDVSNTSHNFGRKLY